MAEVAVLETETEESWSSVRHGMQENKQHVDANIIFIHSRADLRANQSQWQHIPPVSLGIFVIRVPSADHADIVY